MSSIALILVATAAALAGMVLLPAIVVVASALTCVAVSEARDWLVRRRIVSDGGRRANGPVGRVGETRSSIRALPGDHSPPSNVMSFEEFRRRCLADPEVAREYHRRGPEFAALDAKLSGNNFAA